MGITPNNQATGTASGDAHLSSFVTRYWTAERSQALVELNAAVLSGHRDAAIAALAKLPGWEYRVHGTSMPGKEGGLALVTSLALAAGLDPKQPLPDGAMLVVYSGPATGHGRLRLGERTVDASLDVSGKVPADLDSMWVTDESRILMFGAGRGFLKPDGVGGFIKLELHKR